MKREFLLIILVILILIVLGTLSIPSYPDTYVKNTRIPRLFNVQAIDTMKFSRDAAREAAGSPNKFNQVIEREMTLIAKAGATHAAIATPYDEEFVPVLRRWVNSARAHGLKVWFRGNFSGWENWFNYEKIGREEHKKLLDTFIRNHADLFENGDIFSPCPECENGGAGDPRNVGDAQGFKNFLVDEYSSANNNFKLIGKSVSVLTSMNADIARYVMDAKTVKSLGGTILIDHYVSSPDKLAKDLADIKNKLDADVGLGEFGAPIPDINGDMSESEQAQFVDSLLGKLYRQNAFLPLINYWVLEGGSTELVSGGKPREAYGIIKKYYRMPSISGLIMDTEGKILRGAKIILGESGYSVTSEDGTYQVFVPTGEKKIIVKKEGYADQILTLKNSLATSTIKEFRLEPTNKSIWYKIRAFISSLR